MALMSIASCRNRLVLSCLIGNTRFSPGIRCTRTLPCNRNILPFNKFTFPLRVFKRTCSGKHGPGKIILFSKSEFERLVELGKSEKVRIIGAITALGVYTVMTIVITLKFGKLVDYVVTNEKSRDEIAKFLIPLAALLAIFAACSFARVYLMLVAENKITLNLRQKVFESIMRQEVAFFDRYKTGELVSRLSADASLVGQSLTSNMADGMKCVLMFCSSAVMTFFMSPQLATFGIGIVPPVVVVAAYYGRFVKKITRDIQDKLSLSNSVAQESISNIRTVKAFSNEKRTIDSYSTILDDIFKKSVVESQRRGTFTTFTGVTGQLMFFSVIFYGGVLVKNNAMTFGELSSFLMFMMYMGTSIPGLANFYTALNKSLGSSLRLWEIIDSVPAIPISGGLVPAEDPRGHIKFENVHFSYPSRRNVSILEGLNLDIAEGSVTAIVGSSGSGKSTIASLLLRFYDPNYGVVRLDGVNINELDPQWLKKHIGFVGQEPVLFSGTIRENILYGTQDPSSVTESEIMEAAREANCLGFITKDLSKGFETEVGERGIMLSGGQKQRVALARALIKNPKILVLDEATSALDSESERLVQEALERIMKGRTVLTIAHRLSTIMNADEIIVLDKGRVVQKGTYKELVEMERGLFRRLIKHQTIV